MPPAINRSIDVPSIEEWESRLLAVANQSDEDQASEPAVELFFVLLSNGRDSRIAESFPLTIRRLFEVLDRDGVHELLNDYRTAVPTQIFGEEDGVQFAAWLRTLLFCDLDLQRDGTIESCLRLDEAAHASSKTGQPVSIELEVDPDHLIDRSAPETRIPDRGQYLVTVGQQ